MEWLSRRVQVGMIRSRSSAMGASPDSSTAGATRNRSGSAAPRPGRNGMVKLELVMVRAYVLERSLHKGAGPDRRHRRCACTRRRQWPRQCSRAYALVMPRPASPVRPSETKTGRRTHSEEAILAAVRDLLLEAGPRGVTTAAVSVRSGAPTGSLYHRFGSRAAMVAELWVRTIRRFHAFVFEATSSVAPGLPRALALGQAVVSFAAEHPEDARLLLIASREELAKDSDLPSGLTEELATLNQPVE